VPDAAPNAEKKPDVPRGFWGTILTATPIILTVLSTAFAGLSSSEMTRSMYYRSLAAQHQSKAGDQWAFFQAKRMRGTSMETTADLLESLGHPEQFDPKLADEVCGIALKAAEKSDSSSRIKKASDQFAALRADEKSWNVLVRLNSLALPRVDSSALANSQTQSAVDAAVADVRQRKTEAETAAAIGALAPVDIEAAISNAEHDADAFDQAIKPMSDVVKRYREALNLLAGSTPSGSGREAVDRHAASFKLAALQFDAKRLRREADFNQHAGELYELRVRRSGLESDRHRHRSEMFFYSMLVAQFGVTVASLALARAHRSGLWLLAAAAGAASLGFTGYIYVTR
jgi:hypothetical protein